MCGYSDLQDMDENTETQRHRDAKARELIHRAPVNDTYRFSVVLASTIVNS
jgi:hypothetical protein